jgi:hypothetical protein
MRLGKKLARYKINAAFIAELWITYKSVIVQFCLYGFDTQCEKNRTTTQNYGLMTNWLGEDSILR